MRDLFLHYPCSDMLQIHSTTHEESFVLFAEGKKLEIERITEHTGGGATNAAVSFSRMGLDTTIICKLGNDQSADFIKKQLIDERVSTNLCTTTDKSQTGTSFIIPCSSGERTVLIHRGANLLLNESDIPYTTIGSYNLIYITSLSGTTGSLIVSITKQAHEKGALVAVNPGSSQLQKTAHYLNDALPYIDILILNTHEATLLMNTFTDVHYGPEQLAGSAADTPLLIKGSAGQTSYPFDLTQFMRQVIKHGPSTIAVTNGAEGVYVGHKNTIYFHPTVAKTVISTLGAGDAFASAFVAQLLNKNTITYALHAGSVNSASVLEYTDCKAGLLTQATLKNRIELLSSSLIKTFQL